MRFERVGVTITISLLAALSGCAAVNDGSTLPGSAGILKGDG
jgi:hypothetical protein